MAVDDLSRRVLYVGDGSATEFAFNFVVFVTTDVAVYTKDEEGEDKLISPSNYTVTLNENQDNNPGGVVKFNSAPADEAVIAVVSAVPETQPMVLTTYDGFDPEVLNKSADRAVSLIQQLSDDVSRSIRLPRTSQKTTAAAYEELVTAAEKAEAALALSEKTIAAAEAVQTALDEAGDVTGAVPVVAEGASAKRALSERFSDAINVRDFGAKGDGVTDDLQAFQAAARSGKFVYVPEGEYLLSEPVTDGEFELARGAVFPREALFYGRLDTTFRKKIVKELPIRFAGYDSALAAVREASGTNIPFLYPQGIGFDADSNLYISYANSSFSDVSTGLTAIVRYDSKFAYAGYVLVQYGIENVVIADIDGARYLFFRSSANGALMRYDITAASWSGETLIGEIVIRGIDSNYDFDGNKWYALQSTPDVGGSPSRTIINVYDADFSRVSTLSLPKTVVGWQTSSSAYYNYVPKMQGFCVSAGHIYVAHGGHSYQNASTTPQRVSDIGCSELAPDGTLLRYGVLDSAKFAARLREMGYSLTRTEAEANCSHPCGGVFGIYVTQGLSDDYAVSGGVLIVREFAEDGEDFTDIASGYAPATLSRYAELFPLTQIFSDGVSATALVNPITGEQIASLSDLLTFMSEVGLASTGFSTASVSLATIDPIELPTYSFVSVKNCNNAAARIDVVGAYNRGAATYYCSKTTSGWTAYQSKPIGQEVILDAKQAGTWSRVIGRLYDGSGEYVNLLSALPYANGTMSVYFGGGSSVLRTATWLNFFTAASSSAPDATAKGGKNVLRIAGTYVSPSLSDESVSLGQANMPWKDLYVATGAISTSDERLKRDIVDPDEALMRAWGRVGFKVFRFRSAVEQKGDAARLHIGVIAQEVRDAFAAEGLDADRYGLFCRDAWEAEPEEIDPATGEVLRPAIAAGEKFSIRYDEALALECAYQRWRLAKIEARIAE